MDQALSEHLHLIRTRAKDQTFGHALTRKRLAIAEKFASRGFGPKSGPQTAAMAGVYRDALDEAVRTALVEMPAAVRAVYQGRLPDDVALEVAEELNSMIEGLSAAATHAVEELYLNADISRSAAKTEFESQALNLKRDVRIAFGDAKVRAERRREPPQIPQVGPNSSYDIFMSHASEDKPLLVDGLVLELESRNLRVWYDSTSIKMGDRLFTSIDDGMAKSRFGVVVLSEHYLRKPWTKSELATLGTLAMTRDRKVILPILHEVTVERVAEVSPTLAGLLAVNSAIGLHALGDAIVAGMDTAAETEDR